MCVQFINFAVELRVLQALWPPRKSKSKTVTTSCLVWRHWEHECLNTIWPFHNKPRHSTTPSLDDRWCHPCNSSCLYLTANNVHIHSQTSCIINQRCGGSTQPQRSNDKIFCSWHRRSQSTFLQVSALSRWPYLCSHFVHMKSKVTCVQCYLWNVVDFAKVAFQLALM